MDEPEENVVLGERMQSNEIVNPGRKTRFEERERGCVLLGGGGGS